MSRLVPAYFHPALAAADWDRLTGTDLRGSYVVVNVADGPGPGTDTVLGDRIDRLAATGAAVLGYLDTGYGARPQRAIVRDAVRWFRRHAVDGLFCDQILGTPEAFLAESALAGALRAEGALELVLNPGRPVDQRYRGICDVLVDFEGPWSAYRERPARVAAPGPARLGHLVHGVPEGELGTAAELLATRAQFGYLSVLTGANPWRALSPTVGRPVFR